MDPLEVPPNELDFGLSEMSQFSSAIRKMGQRAGSMEEVANRVVDHLYENLVDSATGRRACVLARFYKTHAFGMLEPSLQEFALAALRATEAPSTMRCLTMLATRGERSEWNHRKSSKSHQTIPLQSEEMVDRFPMVSQLIRQFGVEMSDVLSPKDVMVTDELQKSFGIFFVPDALGSRFIPAQDEFVKVYGVRSCVGFGGMLPSGSIFAVILFSRVTISRTTADLFAPLALSTKFALFPFDGQRVFGAQSETA